MQSDPDVPTSLAMDEWLARLAEPTGAPGGGSAAGVMMALSAALLHMVCGYTPDEPVAAEAGERVRELREASLRASEEDGVRSVALGAALREDGPDRSARLYDAAVAAAASSADLAEVGIALVAQLRLVAEVGNPHLVADTGVASESLRAGLGAALINLRANISLARSHAAETPDSGDAADSGDTSDSGRTSDSGDPSDSGVTQASAELGRLSDVGARTERARSEIDAVLAALPLD
ncbi:cyclodeaminase/cyclohydrolase family protein [Microbacterium lushaniae]|nr:cyclodeaminase/cyclohydrolase family protein [Microbacterium lushaniae]